jgi:TIR domain
MTDLVVDRGVLSEVAWCLRQGEQLPAILRASQGRLLYERPGMSALEGVLFENPSLGSRLEAIPRDLVSYSDTEWNHVDARVRDASGAVPVIEAADHVNRVLRGPQPTPEETVKYLFRLLMLAHATTSDALIWRPRAPILDAFFQALGVSTERIQEQGQEGRSIKDGFLDVTARQTSLGPVKRIPQVWFAGRDRAQGPKPVEVFVSYSTVDRTWSERLSRMLRPLEILGSARVFVDTRIVPGSGWEDEIIAAIERAEVYVTLVSEHYLSSEFVMRVELPRIIERADRGEAELWWYLISPCLWEQTPLARIQAAHDVSIPLEYSNMDAIAKSLKACATSVATKHSRRE